MSALSRIVLLFIFLVLSCTLCLWYQLSPPPHISSYFLHVDDTGAVPTMVKNSCEVVRVQGDGGSGAGACGDRGVGRKDIQENVLERPHGFVLTSHYAGQQGAAMLALISQQCWLQRSHLPMIIVEPFVRNSFLYGFPTTFKRKQSMDIRLRDLVDLNQFDSISHKQGIDRLGSWEEFVADSPRKIIVVMVHHSRRQDWLPAGRAAEKDRQGKQKCYSQELTGVRWMHILARYGQKFCIVKVIHLMPDGLWQARAILGSHDPRDVTLVFDWWSWHWDLPVSNALSNTRSAQLTCRATIREHLNEKLVPSQQLVRYAQEYEQRYLGWGKEEEDRGGTSRGVNMTEVPKRYVSIAVMLRIERVVHDVGRGKTDSKLLSKVNSCLAKVVEYAKELEIEREAEKRVFVVSDYGKFGSRTWMYGKRPSKEMKRKIFERVLNITATKLVHSRINFKQWEDSFVSVTEGRDDPGYIAALQRVLASRADCLIMVGGGNFMKLAYGDYLSRHPYTLDQCVRFVCFNDRFLKEYLQFNMNAS